MHGFLRHFLVRCARSDRAGLQVAADRGVHLLLNWTLPPLFGELEEGLDLAWYAQQMRVPVVGEGFGAKATWNDLMVSGGSERWPAAGRYSPGRGPVLLIWHHGAGEFPVDASITNAALETGLDAPLAALRAPGHQTFSRYVHQMRTSHGAAAMMVASAFAAEALRRWWRGPCVIGGLSLGGMVTLLHAHCFGAHALAEGLPLRWAPIAAGPDFAPVIQASGFAQLVEPATRRAPHLPGLLALPQLGFAPSVGDRIRPLLGAWDLVHRLRHQGPAYRRLGIRPRVIRRGHIGLSVDGIAIGEHLRRCLDQVADEWADGPPSNVP